MNTTLAMQRKKNILSGKVKEYNMPLLNFGIFHKKLIILKFDYVDIHYRISA